MAEVNINDLSRFIAENMMDLIQTYLRDLEANQTSEQIALTGFDEEDVRQQEVLPEPVATTVPDVQLEEDDGNSSGGEPEREVEVKPMTPGRVERPEPTDFNDREESMTADEFIEKFKSIKVTQIRDFMKTKGIQPSGARKKADLLRIVYDNENAREDFSKLYS